MRNFSATFILVVALFTGGCMSTGGPAAPSAEVLVPPAAAGGDWGLSVGSVPAGGVFDSDLGAWLPAGANPDEKERDRLRGLRKRQK